MAKKQKVKDINGQEKFSVEQVKSVGRISLLQSEVMKSVQRVSEEVDSPFTYAEINDVFLKIAHSYNKRNLEAQYKS